MDWSDLGLILFGAAMSFGFGEVRALLEKGREKEIRAEERDIRNSEAIAERTRALWTKGIEGTRYAFLSMLERRIESSGGNGPRAAEIDAALSASGHLDHFDPALLGDPSLLTKLVKTTLEIDRRGPAKPSWSVLRQLTDLKLEVNAAMLEQENRIALGEAPTRMHGASGVDSAALAATVGGIADWHEEMRQLFPTESENP